MPGGAEAEAACDKFVERGVEVLLVSAIAVALHIVSPVVDCTEPVLLLVAISGVANAFGVLAEVDVLERGNLREDLVVQETVVVRASGLNGSTAPPAATFSDSARSAFHWARSPGGIGHSCHRHALVNCASMGLTDQGIVPGAIGALGAGCGCRLSVVVLVASGPGCITTGLPHGLSQKSGNVRKTLLAVSVTQVELAVTDFVVLANSLAEAFPCVSRVELCEANGAANIRLLQDRVDLGVTSALVWCGLARSLRKLALKMAVLSLGTALVLSVDTAVVAVSPAIAEPATSATAETVSWWRPFQGSALITSVPALGRALAIKLRDKWLLLLLLSLSLRLALLLVLLLLVLLLLVLLLLVLLLLATNLLAFALPSFLRGWKIEFLRLDQRVFFFVTLAISFGESGCSITVALFTDASRFAFRLLFSCVADQSARIVWVLSAAVAA